MNIRKLGMAVLCLSLFVQAGAGLYAQKSPEPSASTAATPKASVNEEDFVIGSPESGMAADQTNHTIESFGIWDLLKMILVLALVIGAAYGILHLIKKNKGSTIADDGNLMRILASQGLPGNRWLHLVAVQKEVFLIGSADNSVNLISRIENPETCDELLLLASREQAGPKQTFTDLLGSVFSGDFMKGAGKPVQSPPRTSGSAEGESAGNAGAGEGQEAGPSGQGSGEAGSATLKSQRERLRNL